MTVDDHADEPWGRQPKESEAAFLAFVEYREQPYRGGLARRSLRKCAASVGRNPKRLFFWSEKHRWVERARQYDSWLASQEIEADKAEIKARRRRNGRISDQLTTAGLRKLQGLDVDKLTHKEAAKYLELALKFAKAFEAIVPDEGPKLQIDHTSSDGSMSPALESLLISIPKDSDEK